MRVPIIYLAHEFSGDMCNLDRADRWCAFLSLQVDAMFVAPWVALCRHWPDSGATRARGLALDLAAVRRFDGLVAVQRAGKTQLSPGQQKEWDEASAARVPLFLIDEAVMVYPDGDYAASELQRLREFVAKREVPS